MYIEGSISALQCILMSGVFIGLIVSVIATPHGEWTLFAVVAAAIVFLIPVAMSRLEKKSDKDYYDERIEEYRAAIEADPRNMAARSKLGDTLYNRGRLDEAIEVYTEIVTLAPNNGPDAQRLRSMQRERDEKIVPPITCPSCGRRNPGDRTKCGICESDLNPGTELARQYKGEFKGWLKAGGLRQLTIISVIAIVAVGLVSVSLSRLPDSLRGIVITILILLFITAEVVYIYRRLDV